MKKIKKQIKITLLEDCVIGIGIAEKGQSNYWDIDKNLGDNWLIKNGHKKTIITKKELKIGEKHVEPNWSLPLGLHIKLEVVLKKSFWERIFSLN